MTINNFNRRGGIHGKEYNMKKYFWIVIGTMLVCILFMVEGAFIAVCAMRSGVSFELPTIKIEKEAHEFQLVER